MITDPSSARPTWKSKVGFTEYVPRLGPVLSRRPPEINEVGRRQRAVTGSDISRVGNRVSVSDHCVDQMLMRVPGLQREVVVAFLEVVEQMPAQARDRWLTAVGSYGSPADPRSAALALGRTALSRWAVASVVAAKTAQRHDVDRYGQFVYDILPSDFPVTVLRVLVTVAGCHICTSLHWALGDLGGRDVVRELASSLAKAASSPQ